MDTLPEFVLDVVEEVRRAVPRNGGTGWETVRFQLVEEPESPPSVFSTAAAAPWKPIFE
jgi:hypothetical protein